MFKKIRQNWEVFFILIVTCLGTAGGTLISAYHSVIVRSTAGFLLRPLVGMTCCFAASVLHVMLFRVINTLTRGRYQHSAMLQALQFTLIMYGCLMGTEIVFFPDRLHEPSHHCWIFAATALACVVSSFIFIHHRLTTMIQVGMSLIEKYHLQIIRSLINVLETRDPSKKGHSERIAEGCEIMGQLFDVPEETRDRLKRAALMHDLGMIFVDESLIQKESALTPEELAEIRLHPFIVERILAPLNILSWETSIIKASQLFIYSVSPHREGDLRWQQDHKGSVKTFLEHSLPDKKVEDMPIEARILSVVDFYDTLTHSRPYREAFSSEETLKQMKEEAGRRFDEKMVDVLAGVVQEGKWPGENRSDSPPLASEDRIVRDVQNTAKNLNILYTFYLFMGSEVHYGTRALILAVTNSIFMGVAIGFIIYASTSNPVWTGLFVLQGVLTGIVLFATGFTSERVMMERCRGTTLGGPLSTFIAYSFGGFLAGVLCYYVIIRPALSVAVLIDGYALLYIMATVLLCGSVGLFYRYMREQSNRLMKNQEKIQKIFLDLVLSLSYALESADPCTKGHSEKVSLYARRIGELLKLSSAELEELEKAALLHDIGKMGISKVILNKPSKLTDEEFRIIRTHPDIGAKTLALVGHLSPIAPLVKAHHESFDGKGYPDHKSMEEIPLFARIIAIADSYDAMVSNRAYRKALPHEAAIDELKRCAGSQFDPKIVDLFIKSFEGN